ncbi:MAG: glycoside hydrolase family 127 protein [Candidatus Hydrogenedentes bacterium]|nr:glycoside hydrolase family 127 protein [Candidatus Hydrogenedentota bacterium]
MRTISIAALRVMLAVVSSSAAGAQIAEKGKTVVQSFDYRGVTLHDSRLKMQFDEVRDFYLRLPNDDILRGYRLRAGLPAPGADLAGCYIGHNTFGQILSGLARMYAATGDAACKEKAEALLKGWAECLAPDGFFFIEKDPQLPPYYYDKMVCGLVDLMVYCGNQDAAGYLGRITDWAIAHLDRTRAYARPTGPGGGEWYTLSENLYRAYLATGDAKYRDFAAVWEYTEFWDLLKNKEDIFQHDMKGGGYHAYSHVNSMNGLGAAFAVTGEPRYLETLKNGFDFLHDSQLWVTGGYGPNESLAPRPTLAAMLKETSSHFETQCGSWAAFKMSKYLIRFTGDARYGDWIELLVLNGIGASIPMDPDGSVFYYSEYNLGGSAKQNTAPWACCSGTRPQAVADFHDLIYFHDETSLYVNLFTPSSVDWSCGGAKVKIDQATRFPETGKVEFTAHAAAPVTFALKVRAPGWLAGPMKASVNGAAATVEVDAHGWAVFSREWKDGDKLAVELPMEFRVSHFLKDKPFPAAITFGPVTMVARCLTANPSKKIDFTNVAAALEPLAGDPLNYRVKSDNSILIRPFYQTKKGERYFLYMDPSYPSFRIPSSAATLSPGWTNYVAWHASNVIGATAQYTFTGESITVLGALYDDAGRMEVKIDGKVAGTIDQYGPNRGEAKHWDFTGLGAGSHTILLTLLPDKTEASKGNFANIAGFEFSG